jgi:hypothetical protein
VIQGAQLVTQLARQDRARALIGRAMGLPYQPW